MADLTITAANVKSSGVIVYGTAGEAVTRGRTAYQEAATKKWKLADSNAVAAEVRSTKGIFLNDAANDQPVAIHIDGPINLGATLTLGTAYYQSDTPGGICPVADVGAGEQPTVLGIATSTSMLNFKPNTAGATI